MKEIFTTIGHYLLALALLGLEALCWIVIGLPYRLWEKWNYEAQCLRYPPPRGGMWGNMAREYKNRPDKQDRPDRQ